MRRIFQKLLLLTVLLGGLIFNPLSAKARAQQYEPCDTANPNYCTECRDESKRDFAKCGEIDYLGVDLWASGRLPPLPKFFPPDLDTYTNKCVFAADIGKKGKSEIFIADMMFYKDGKGKSLAKADPTTQKRLTWDGSGEVINANAFFTKDRSVAYQKMYLSGSSDHFIIDLKTGKWTKMDYSKFKELFKEIHDSNSQIVVPPSN